MILYAITDEKLTPIDTMFKQVEQALIGGVKYVQLRDKTKTYSESLNSALKLKDLCDKYSAYFIVNDSVKLAKESNAHGVHIGESDDDVKAAKDILGDKVIIGASCYGSVERAITAVQNGATYAAFGSMFASPTKPHSKVVPLNVLTDAKKTLSVPICAIGGIEVGNVKSIFSAGADMAAVISGLWNSDDIAQRARQFLA